MSDFGKKVADEYRKIRTDITSRSVKPATGVTSTSTPEPWAVDPQVKEQMVADLLPVLDRLIKKHDPVLLSSLRRIDRCR